MLVVYGGKGWEWRSGKGGKGGKGKSHKEKKKVMFLSDMWQFHLDSNQWTPIDYGEGPLGRWKEGATPVFNNSQLVLMGGSTETSVKFARNDVWVFKPLPGGGGAWRKVRTSNTPVPRRGHVIVANHSHVIMFGGKTTPRLEKRAVEEMEENFPDLEYTPQRKEKCLIDLWAISKDEMLAEGSSHPPRWREGAPFPAGCRWGGTGSFLRDNLGKKYLAMFGGRHLSAGSEEHKDTSVYVYYDDLWLYDFVEDSWSQAPTKGARPCPRDHHGAATLNDKLYIYGGRQSERRAADSVLSDVWSYDINTHMWTEHVPVGMAPSARFMPGVSEVLYKGTEHLAVFAGEMLPGSTKRTTLNDVWVFNPSSAVWTELFASTCGHPAVEEEHASLTTQGSSALLHREFGCLAVVFCLLPLAYTGIRRFLRPGQAREMQQPFLS
ncbi:Klhdc2 [Symbiodinium natans]|uniref:Klhdc2 protein n=1 Tax=Symbiodinium natans TaxID=878477 RepID=A0A812URH8_9DINO|nr:Klhdc2 [Symbiodinium natans]